MVPEGWSLSTIGEHVDLLTGFAFKSKHYTENRVDTRLLRGDNVGQGYLRWRDAKRWPSNKVDGLEKYSLKAGDLVIAMDRTWIPAGVKVSEVAEDDLPCLLVQRVSRLRANVSFEQGLLKQIFSSHRFEQYVKKVQTETAVPHISPTDIREFPILLPPIAEQAKIAEILSKWDRAIENVSNQLDLTRKYRDKSVGELVLGRIRFPEFTCTWNESGIDRLEKDGLMTLGRGKVISRKDIEQKPGDYPIYSSSVKNNGLFGTYGEYMFDEELITWSVDGGGNFFHRGSHRFSVTNVSGFMKVDTSTLNYKFIATQLQHLHSRLTFDYQTKAHPSVIRKLYPLRFPSLAEQERIASVIQTIDNNIEAYRNTLKALQSEKKALMQQLLTGKRRVRLDQKDAKAATG